MDIREMLFLRILILKISSDRMFYESRCRDMCIVVCQIEQLFLSIETRSVMQDRDYYTEYEMDFAIIMF